MEEIHTFDESSTDSVKKSLSDFMGMTTEQFMIFCCLMESTQSVICGAFILHSLSEFEDYHPETIHIHCSYKGALEINNFLKDEKIVKIEQQNVHITETNNIPSESEAFFFKNRIKARLHYFISHEHPHVYPRIKIYISENPENILETVKNFDLSLTQIWFDGNNLNATYQQTDIEQKECYINSEYTDFILHFNPILLERINTYKKRGFVLKYDIPSTTVTIRSDEDLYVIPDNLIVNFLYRNLIRKMVNNLIEYNNPDYKEILGQADFYLTYFWLENYLEEDPLKLLLNLLKKLEMKKCLLPSWIQYTYTEQNKARKREFKPYKPPTEDEQNKTEIVKMLLFEVCELSKFILSSIKKFKLYKKTAFQIVSKKYKLDIQSIYDISKKHQHDKDVYDNYKYERKQTLIYDKAKMLCLKKDEEIRFQKVAKDIRKKNNTREIEWLNITDPIVTDPVRFNEKELVSYHSQPPSMKIEDDKEVYTNKRGCMSIHTFGIYNINSYLKGEAVEGYNTQDDTRDEDLDLVEEDSRERLVFFLANSTDLSDLTPYCYTLSDLANDVGHRLYLNCENGRTTQKDELLEQIDNAIIKLSLGGNQIYVPLGEIIHAIYNTKKQIFILIPTEKVFKYTASMVYTYRSYNVRSIDHCQDGSKKNIHTIRVCQGDGQDDDCWPIDEKLEIVQYTKDTFYLERKYYVDDQYIEYLDVDQTMFEESLTEDILIDNLQDEMREILSFMDHEQRYDFLDENIRKLLNMSDNDRDELAFNNMSDIQKLLYKTRNSLNFMSNDEKNDFLTRYITIAEVEEILNELEERDYDETKIRDLYKFIKMRTY
jgi:hypothetical protein